MNLNRSHLQASLLVTPLALALACGGDDAKLAGPCSSGPKADAPVAVKSTEAKTAPSGDLKPWAEALSQADLATYGKQVFLAKGSNTCNDCHGADGKKGRLEQAANLTDPASWDVTKAVGGDKAKIKVALTYLVSNGGTKFNESFVQENPDMGWDWSKTDGTAYDIQMFGVTQSSTQAEIKKIRKTLKKNGVALEKGDLIAFGTQAVLAYLETIEEPASSTSP